VTAARRARYRGLPKTRLQHVYSAVALNLIRLHAYWNGRPLDAARGPGNGRWLPGVGDLGFQGEVRPLLCRGVCPEQ
jgi:hypothetical protein